MPKTLIIYLEKTASFKKLIEMYAVIAVSYHLIIVLALLFHFNSVRLGFTYFGHFLPKSPVGMVILTLCQLVRVIIHTKAGELELADILMLKNGNKLQNVDACSHFLSYRCLLMPTK